MQEKWEEIKMAYIESNRIFCYERLRLNERRRDFLPLLLSLLITIAVASALYHFESAIWPIVVMMGAVLFMVIFFLTIDRKLSRAYPEQYKRYYIYRQWLSERFDYLAYAFFIDKISDKGYTSEELKIISDYSETLNSPPKPFLINQHFITVILVSILVSLFSAYVQKIPAWPSKAPAYLFAFTVIVVIVSMVLDVLRTSRMRDARIRCYIRRAQIELENRESLRKKISDVQSSI